MKNLITISAILTLFLAGCSTNPVSNFVFSPAQVNTGEEVQFENLSVDATSFEWIFGDGTTSNAYDPVHKYMSGGIYTVQLKAFGRHGGMDISQATITVISVDPVADFSVYTNLPGENGPVPVETDIVFVGEQVEFYNYSVDAAAYSWNFGDGYGSEFESPVYSFDEPGSYTVILTAFGFGNEQDVFARNIEVVEGINSALRITVLEYYDEYPVQNASVILYGSVADWTNEVNSTEEVFTTPLGKCVFEGLNYQRYYVDVWEADHDNYALAAEDVGFIETQPLEPGYIHDFIAYVDYYEPGKKAVLTRIGKKKLEAENVALKKAAELRTAKENKFSRQR